MSAAYFCTSSRTASGCGASNTSTMRYAIAAGRATRDVSADLKGALAPKGTKNYPAITVPAKVGALLRAIDDFDGMPGTCAALKLAPWRWRVFLPRRIIHCLLTATDATTAVCPSA